ncbi:hypothetical protein [Oryzobacter terrae]|uniref:hypothetical protein n=1 Tax=Oryzobacter terrae TaxID=1620385 RepID=UPI00366AD7C4
MSTTRGLTATVAVLAAATVGVLAAQPALAHGDAPATPEVRSALAKTRAGVAAYHRVDRALAAGFVPATECVQGMGVHYADLPRLFDGGVVDPSHPEVLVYEPQADGSMRLVATEFIVVDEGQARPTYAGVPFDGPSVLGGLPVYTLHAWVGLHNAHGIFTPHNEASTCG